MAVTVPLRVQGPGYWSGWESITGATYAWQAVDDSSGTTHDSDTTYIVLPRRILLAGIVSFPVFYQCDPGRVISVSVTVGAKIESGIPELQIGFYRGGSTGFHATTFTPAASYSTATVAFTTNPITGLAWAAADLAGLELCVQMVITAVAKARITLVSGSMSAAMPTNTLRQNDGRWRTS